MKWILYIVGIVLGIVTPFVLVSGEMNLCIGAYGAGAGLLILAMTTAALTGLCFRSALRVTSTPPIKGSGLSKIIAMVVIVAATSLVVYSRWNASNYHLESINSQIKDAIGALQQGRVYLSSSDFDSMERTINSCGFWVSGEEKAGVRENLKLLQRETHEFHEQRQY